MIDAGRGIDLPLLPHLFDRFARLSTSVGLGIGLYMARQIAEAHRGTLEVKSCLGVGTDY